MSSITKGVGSANQEANGGVLGFNNVSYITAEDTSYATSGNSSSGSTLSYRLYGYNCGFNIPAGSTINGIQVDVILKGTVNAIEDRPSWYGAWIRKADGSFGSTNKKDSGYVPTQIGNVTLGGSSDLWGETWTPNDINDADFGCGIQFNVAWGGTTNPKYTNVSVDYMSVTVYYTINFIPQIINIL